MKRTIFEYADYKRYLEDWILSQPREGRGLKAKIADAIRCQAAYVSQVLSGSAHFSLEQADQINRFVRHRKEESAYLLLLVQHARAGTPTLREHFAEQLELHRRKHVGVKAKRFQDEPLSPEEQVVYYSYWEYAAIHVLVSLPQFRTREALAEYLRLPASRVIEVLKFLETSGLVRREGDRYSVGARSIHLERDSPMIARVHSNWRFRAVQMIERGHRENLHYSSLMAISREDVEKLKAMIREFIQTTKPVIRESKEEVLHCLLIDWFPV